MAKWEPETHHEDPQVNALLNIAEALTKCADSISGLLYGLKYGKQTGMSIAEAVEVGNDKLAEAITQVAHAIDDHRKSDDAP